jgi:hypothetical protein
MTRLDSFLAYSESNRLVVSGVAAVLVTVIAAVDWVLPAVTFGYMYLLPILLAAAALNRFQILGMAVLCAYLREAFDPLQSVPGATGEHLLAAFDPLQWAPGSTGRLLVVTVGCGKRPNNRSESSSRRARWPF